MTTSQSISWTDVAREATDHLSRILAINSGCPPVYELPAARYLLGLFEREGIPAVILPPSCGSPAKTLSGPRPNLVAHLPGGGADEPLLLLSHLDSARKSVEDWGYDPGPDGSRLRGSGSFGGVHLAVAHAMALILLARNETPMRRTVRYAATSEGMGGRGTGLATLAADYIEHITSDIAISWGGLSWTGDKGESYSFLATADKGVLYLKLKSEGSGGYPGIRGNRDPVESLVRMLEKIRGLKFPLKLSSASRTLIQSIAAILPDNKSVLFHDLLDPAVTSNALAILEADKEVDSGLVALVRAALGTDSTVMHLEAGRSDGLKPLVAEATLALSYPPGEDPESLALKVMELLAQDGVYLAEKEVLAPSESELAPEVHAMIRAALTEIDPHALLINGLAPWVSGLGSFRRFGTSVLGWEPFISEGPLARKSASRTGTGESIDPADFVREIRAVYSFLVRIAQ